MQNPDNQQRDQFSHCAIVTMPGADTTMLCGFRRSQEADKVVIEFRARKALEDTFRSYFGGASSTLIRQLTPGDMNQLGDATQVHPGTERATWGSPGGGNADRVMSIYALQVDPRDGSQIGELQIEVGSTRMAMLNLTSLYLPLPFEPKQHYAAMDPKQVGKDVHFFYFDSVGYLDAPIIIPPQFKWNIMVQAPGDRPYTLILHGEVMERDGAMVCAPSGAQAPLVEPVSEHIRRMRKRGFRWPFSRKS